ncbi:hypothetical protein BHM03_00061004 [Ensete ventricosum]|nr:hypothetical protein BHM03_00061004 [Ensete ventricosum]
MQRSEASSVADRQVRRPSVSVTSFRRTTSVCSSFHCQVRGSQLPPPLMDTSEASAATAIRSFFCCPDCHLQLPLTLLLSSVASSVVAVVVRSFSITTTHSFPTFRCR